ncbi:hypothetical protein ACUXJP_000636 [Staphylococcus cohnii]
MITLHTNRPLSDKVLLVVKTTKKNILNYCHLETEIINKMLYNY